ncbi:hypothetical protein N8603_00860 [Verrucomicrobiales bacterium]|nr:hypothetical protein [Verrucomicrobiales bacterium]
MLYCSDCDKDVEFKSLDVGGMLTHCCIECGSTNLFRSKDEFEKEKSDSIKSNFNKRKNYKKWLISILVLILIIGGANECKKIKDHKASLEWEAEVTERYKERQKEREKVIKNLLRPGYRENVLSGLKVGDEIEWKLFNQEFSGNIIRHTGKILSITDETIVIQRTLTPRTLIKKEIEWIRIYDLENNIPLRPY